MCEILAPAGGVGSAYAAINSGANALYLGLKQFSARNSAENFDINAFVELARYAHAFGVKIYVAMNTLVKDGELEQFLSDIIEVWNSGADAIIISDIFLGKFIKQNYPEIKLHLSTQAGICNVYGAKLAKKFGFDRVILARETPIEEIKLITGIIETEVFVQGALCTCFSGQCYMSSFAGGNSGNRGRCKQPCRKLYSIDGNGCGDMAYRLSLADLSVGNRISELVEAGVSSFKIEGRMRRPEYVAAAVQYYVDLLEGKDVSVALSNLKRTYNRGNYTKGLAFGQDKTFISSAIQGHIGEYAGAVKVENGRYLCFSKLKFAKGDGFKILRGGREVGGAEFSENMQNGFIISSGTRLLNGDKVFVTTDTTVNENLLKTRRKITVEVTARFFKGEKPLITVGGLTFYGDKILQGAVNRPLTVDDIKSCFNKVDRYPFSVKYGAIDTDGVFMASSEINALRRRVYEEYFNAVSKNNNKQVSKRHILPTIQSRKNTEIAVILTQNIKTAADIEIYKPFDYGELSDIPCDKYLYLPPFMTSAEIEHIKPALNRVQGIYCDGSWAMEVAEEVDIPLFAGTGMNISNSVGVMGCTATYIALSKELTFAEQSRLARGNVFALSSGDIKLMDLIYCPFGKRCGECDKRQNYILRDEEGRKFPLRRYKTGGCRFEVYNCSSLCGASPVGTFLDCTLEPSPEHLIKIHSDIGKQKEYFKNYTNGHGSSPIF